jgi:hypothetical protein
MRTIDTARVRVRGGRTGATASLALATLLAAVACGKVQGTVGMGTSAAPTDSGAAGGAANAGGATSNGGATGTGGSTGSAPDASAPRRVDGGAPPPPQDGCFGVRVRLEAIADDGGPSCTWAVPVDPTGGGASKPLDPAFLNLQFEDVPGQLYLLPLYQVAGPTACGALAAWYFDDASAPTKIVGCPATCTLERRNASGASPGDFQALIGCPAIPVPPP